MVSFQKATVSVSGFTGFSVRKTDSCKIICGFKKHQDTCGRGLKMRTRLNEVGWGGDFDLPNHFVAKFNAYLLFLDRFRET